MWLSTSSNYKFISVYLYKHSIKGFHHENYCRSFAISFQFCVFWLSLRTFCIWLPLPYRLSLRRVQASDPLLYPCCIFLCWLPTVNHQCSSEVEAVVLQALWVLCRWTKELWLKQRDFCFFFQWKCCEHYLSELFDSICNASPHQ